MKILSFIFVTSLLLEMKAMEVQRQNSSRIQDNTSDVTTVIKEFAEEKKKRRESWPDSQGAQKKLSEPSNSQIDIGSESTYKENKLPTWASSSIVLPISATEFTDEYGKTMSFKDKKSLNYLKSVHNAIARARKDNRRFSSMYSLPAFGLVHGSDTYRIRSEKFQIMFNGAFKEMDDFEGSAENYGELEEIIGPAYLKKYLQDNHLQLVPSKNIVKPSWYQKVGGPLFFGAIGLTVLNIAYWCADKLHFDVDKLNFDHLSSWWKK